MQGIFIDGQRPKSKKQVAATIAVQPENVRVEATSMFGNEYDGPVSDMPQGTILFVGPDPYNKRVFYGKITRTASGFRVS